MGGHPCIQKPGYHHAMNEREFHRWLQQSEPAAGALIPLGDDAAVIPWTDAQLVVCTDSVVEGVHFTQGADARAIGAKAAARNLSDLAAMGAWPRGMVAALVLPRACSDSLPQEIVQGLRAACAEFGCPLLGGDTTTHAGGIMVNVTMFGIPLAAQAIPRNGARPGDAIIVTGALGGSEAGRHLRIQPRLHEVRELLKLARPGAMIDVSDGLLLDLERMTTASGCGHEITAEWIPIHADARGLTGDPVERACCDGEDHELLFTLSEEVWRSVQAAWTHPTRLTRIGTMTQSGLRVMRGGADWHPSRGGYVHR